MKVLVVGANGKIGKMVVNTLHEHPDFQVRAMVRHTEQAEELNNRGIESVVVSLEDTVEKISEAITGCDAVVFSAGSGSKTGPDKTLLVDLDGAVKTIEAAEQKDVKRFVMVSALQAHNRENWNEKIRPYYVAKHYADRELVRSSLDYTIIRPGGLLDEPGKGTVTVGEQLTRGTIPREDVAGMIVAVLSEPLSIRKAFDMTSGETQIQDAAAKL